MLERHIQALITDDPGTETPAAGRERLKGHFPAGATRRMTTLGLMVGSALAELDPGEDDAIVYASSYAESRALESFLDSFPAPSPTLFQTSIHPSAVQQLLIGRQAAVRELLPLSGGALFAFHALRAAILSPAPRVLLCGGEERGTWLLDHGLASERTFAFAVSLRRERQSGALGLMRLVRAAGSGELGLGAWFDLLHARSPFTGLVAPGWRMEIEWL
ncbi:MAG TPA: hypothetical protein VN775_11870 [Opitutaceae bacterium]|nr:hypothetical protein [Opitutaceae bacterium]